MIRGTVFDIQKFAIHDGRGIRSTVFLKGCPLKCVWCHNPEGINKKIRLWYFENKCIGCHKCIVTCPQHALSDGDLIQIDVRKCNSCGMCIDVCPTEALCFNGRVMNVDAVVSELLEDRRFYEKSGGGITLSGGEPTFQPEFSLAILDAMKKHGISTAIESCMYCRREVFERFYPLVDEFIVDIKLFNKKEHLRYTGAGNEQILDNFTDLASQEKQILVRIPLIPGITATEENIRAIAEFLYKTNKKIPVELMNFNSLAGDKYRLMKQNNLLFEDAKPFSPEELDRFYKIIKDAGIKEIRSTGIHA